MAATWLFFVLFQLVIHLLVCPVLFGHYDLLRGHYLIYVTGLIKAIQRSPFTVKSLCGY